MPFTRSSSLQSASRSTSVRLPIESLVRKPSPRPESPDMIGPDACSTTSESRRIISGVCWNIMLNSANGLLGIAPAGWARPICWSHAKSSPYSTSVTSIMSRSETRSITPSLMSSSSGMTHARPMMSSTCSRVIRRPAISRSTTCSYMLSSSDEMFSFHGSLGSARMNCSSAPLNRPTCSRSACTPTLASIFLRYISSRLMPCSSTPPLRWSTITSAAEAIRYSRIP